MVLGGGQFLMSEVPLGADLGLDEQGLQAESVLFDDSKVDRLFKSEHGGFADYS